MHILILKWILTHPSFVCFKFKRILFTLLVLFFFFFCLPIKEKNMRHLHMQLCNMFEYALNTKRNNVFCFCLNMRLFVFYIRQVNTSEQTRHL